MLMILVLFILHKTLNRLLQYYLEVQIDLVFHVLFFQIGIFQMTDVHQRGNMNFLPFVLALSITSSLLLTFVRFHAEMFSNFSHSLSTAAFAAGIFIA